MSTGEPEAPNAGQDGASLVLLAREHFHSGRYEATLAVCEAAATLQRRTGDDAGLGSTLNLVGGVHLERGDYELAARAYAEAEEKFRAAKDLDGVGRARANLGLVSWRLGDLTRARADLEAARAVFELSGDARALGNTLNSLGLVAEEEGAPSEAIRLYEAALALVRTSGDRVFEANVQANLADAHEQLGELEQAWGFAQAALQLRLAAGHRRGVVGSHTSLARLALKRGDLARASLALAAGRADAEAMGLRKHLADLEDLQARLAAAEGRWEDAYRTALRASALQKALDREEVARRVAELRATIDMADARRLAEARERENAALRLANAAAEEASRARSEFVAVMSHEIRAPLTAIVGALELLSATADEPREVDLIETAQSSAASLLALVGDVLDLARIDAGRIELETGPVELAALLDQVLACVRGRAEDKAIALRVRREGTLPTRGLGDAARLRQVLLNLLSNAVKFTQRGSVVLTVEATGAGLRFAVEDTGIGIAASVLPRLFQPFAQADSSTTRRFGGSGLGLSIAARLAEAMGGSIQVRSTPGHGSTFTFEVPFPEVTAPPAPPPPRSPARSDAAPSVLVVDDDEDIAQVVCAMLTHLGCAVDHASSAAEATARMAQRRFGVVLLDVHMPDVDGYQLAADLRARHGPDARLVGLSGAATADARERAIRAGMDDYLTKPVTLARLQQVLERRPTSAGRPEAK